MVTASFSRSTSARLTARGGVGRPRVSSAAAAHRKWWGTPSGPSFESTVALALCLASAALVLSCGLYLYVSRGFNCLANGRRNTEYRQVAVEAAALSP
uniref:Uncharacterized protein n=1 Tax=Aegilops tauschii TaxID=37682 RepID=M8CF70_AEGTA